MTTYALIISEAIGQTDPEILDEVEDIMRNDIFHSTLDWQTRDQLQDAAKLAFKELQNMTIHPPKTPWPADCDKPHKNLAYFQGSHGLLECNRQTGEVTNVWHDSDEVGYTDIKRIDPETITIPTCADILSAGFWDNDGKYTVAMMRNDEELWFENPDSPSIKLKKEAENG